MVASVTSSYNVRKRKQSLATTLLQNREESAKYAKRAKLHTIYTPPASPDAMEDVLPGGIELARGDHEDAVLVEVLDFLRRQGGQAICSREISEGLLAEGKIPLGPTPSTAIDAAIKQHHKRCSISNRDHVIKKVADPQFPRKTLYHLANVDPFMPRVMTPKPEPDYPAQSIDTRVRGHDLDSSEAGSDGEADLEHDAQSDLLHHHREGPFAASPETKRCMTFTSSSPELEFDLHIAEPDKLYTPISSVPASPVKDTMEQPTQIAKLNIAMPPSPFITPRLDRNDEDVTEKPIGPAYIQQRHDARGASLALNLESPEEVSLEDLDRLLACF